MAPLTPPPPGTPTPPRDGRLLLRMTRPAFLTVTAVACLLGLSTAAACTGGLKVPRALATLLLALVAHAGANVLNDYFDARNGADAANDQGLFPFTGGSRLIQTGAVSVADTGRWAAFLLLALIPLGLWLAVLSGPGLLAIGAAGLLLAWAYSAPPLALMSRGLGEAAVALAWWLVVIGADYTQRGHFFIIPAVAAVSFALLLANILLINGFPDAESDARVGKRTLVVRLGPAPAAGLYLGLALLAHGWLAVERLAADSAARRRCGAWCRSRCRWRPPGCCGATPAAPQRLRPAIALTIAAASVHGLAMAAGLASRWRG
jgi:1,4-dihydroxy-2-naphthoate octaprenyltransferase